MQRKAYCPRYRGRQACHHFGQQFLKRLKVTLHGG